MLPFSSFEFFILFTIFIGLIGVSKYFSSNIDYKYVLAFINALFLITVYPKPFHFFLLIAYAYLITFLIDKYFHFKFKIWGILLLLLPMLLVKLDIRFHFYPFELNNILSFAGLSYASFRIIGYYLEKSPVEKMADTITYFNFLSFTPTLLIGPIDKYSHFKASEAKGYDSFNVDNFRIGWNYIIKGIAFKYLIAELIDRYWLHLFEASDKQALSMLNTMYAYYAYLFFDFAGYSHMALGLGKMMGMDVPVNFKNPFLALNPQDFWQRFHISLGNWLKDNFFTPLYLFFTRKKYLKPYPLVRQNVALILTFTLMGCWNGFKLNFILSGLIFGIYSAIHNAYIFTCKKKGRDIVFGNLNPFAIKIISIFIMLNLVAVALYIFSGMCPYVK